jgi:hypothetical protein
MDARTTRGELERLINSSIRPLYIKQEILDGDSKMVVEAMEEDNDDIVLDAVVTGGRGGGAGRCQRE